DEAQQMDPQAVAHWMRRPLTAAPPPGESFIDMYGRVVRALENLLKSHQGKRIVLVTHSGPIRAVALRALRVPLSAALHMHVDSTGVTVVDYYDQSPVLVSFNAQPPVPGRVWT